MVENNHRIAVLAFALAIAHIFSNSIIARNTIRNTREIAAIYASFESEKMKAIIDSSIAEELSDGIPTYDRARKGTISNYLLCEDQYKERLYALHFTIDIPLYVQTGEIKLIIDPSPCAFDITYIDNSNGRRRYRATAVTANNTVAEIIPLSKSKQRNIKKALSYKPTAYLHFYYSICYVDVFLIGEDLYYFKNGKKKCKFEEFLDMEKPYLEASDKMRKEMNWPVFSL